MSIDFLCPNGHRLSGPDHLQGRAGQCPHCGEKFEIPVIDESEDHPEGDFSEVGPVKDDLPVKDSPDEEEPIEDFADEDLETIDFADADPPGEGPPEDEDDDEPQMFEEEESIKAFDEEDDDDDLVVSFGSDDQGPLSASDAVHPLCELFELLWEEKQHGATIQIFLGDDDPFEPQWYSPALSQASHALFARKDDDGKYTLTAIAWDAMERIEIGSLDELPEGAFE